MTENLKRIFVPSSVVEALLTHALITEEEEIMGLLFGNVDQLQVATIQKIHVLTRSQKKRDRVEVSDEQLTTAQQEAENVTIFFMLLI
jgi:BRCA1/BRCA2-containing complex subunit 3